MSSVARSETARTDRNGTFQFRAFRPPRRIPCRRGRAGLAAELGFLCSRHRDTIDRRRPKLAFDDVADAQRRIQRAAKSRAYDSRHFQFLLQRLLHRGPSRPVGDHQPAVALRTATRRRTRPASRTSYIPMRFFTPSNSRRSAATSSQVFIAYITIHTKPFDRAFKRHCRASRLISQLALGFVVPHPHLLFRHPDAIQRRQRFFPRDPRPCSRCRSEGKRDNIGYAHFRRRFTYYPAPASKKSAPASDSPTREYTARPFSPVRAPVKCP